jgi:hypothetical protein
MWRGRWEMVAMIVTAVVVIFMLLLVLVALSGHRECVDCRSIKTFNWHDKTPDVSYGEEIMHANFNQYCFECADWTERDDFARNVDGSIRGFIAERHYRAKHPKPHSSAP